MVTVFDANANALIDKAAGELKKIPVIKAPEWAVFVKTSPGKEKVPMRNDWWHVRAAAILRAIYIKGPIGTAKLRTKFGARRYRAKNRRPEHFIKASGSIIRKILQQLQSAGLVDLEAKAIKRGRQITGKGKQLMDNAARQVAPQLKIKKLVEEKPKAPEKPKILTELKPELKVEAREEQSSSVHKNSKRIFSTQNPKDFVVSQESSIPVKSKLKPVTMPIAKPVEESAIKPVVKAEVKAEEKKE
ncbi:MAG: 30S ribosomal protein S19e [Nanoarchaeota archaeon]|nr:30S ribosomal protein S19e [Nanoarchaeota archaeon]